MNVVDGGGFDPPDVLQVEVSLGTMNSVVLWLVIFVLLLAGNFHHKLGFFTGQDADFKCMDMPNLRLQIDDTMMNIMIILYYT